MENNKRLISIDEIIETMHAEIIRRKHSDAIPRGMAIPEFSYTTIDNVAAHENHPFKLFLAAQKVKNFLEKMGLSPLIKLLSSYYPATLKYHKGINIEDLLVYNDTDFINNAYKYVLHREPDEPGFNFYLNSLRKALLHKTEILFLIRYSEEGKARSAGIRGLKRRYFFFTIRRKITSIPVIGYIVEIVIILATLPGMLHRHERIQIEDNKRIMDLHNTLSRMIDTKCDNTRAAEILIRMDNLKNTVHSKADALRIADIMNHMKDLEMNIIGQQRSLSHLLQDRGARPIEPMNNENINYYRKEESHIFDSLYMMFEERFRGSRDVVRERLKVYLPYFENMNECIKNSPVIDIGCGRGEWLELLREHGYQARGVDRNRLMIERCRELNLDASEGDALDFLRSIEDDASLAVTGFHIAEHLPFQKLLYLIDESLRVLKPGGIIIFETPNPENILVGSLEFYTDPSHQNPIPPKTMEFFLEARGFRIIDVVRLFPSNVVKYTLEDELKPIIDRFNMGQDYSVIAVKE